MLVPRPRAGRRGAGSASGRWGLASSLPDLWLFHRSPLCPGCWDALQVVLRVLPPTCRWERLPDPCVGCRACWPPVTPSSSFHLFSFGLGFSRDFLALSLKLCVEVFISGSCVCRSLQVLCVSQPLLPRVGGGYLPENRGDVKRPSPRTASLSREDQVVSRGLAVWSHGGRLCTRPGPPVCLSVCLLRATATEGYPGAWLAFTGVELLCGAGALKPQ